MFKQALWTALLLSGLWAQGQPRTIPNLSDEQISALRRITADLEVQSRLVTSARGALTAGAFAEPRDDGSIAANAESVRAVELTLARARAEAIARLQTSANKLTFEQLSALIAAGGTYPDNAPPREFQGGGGRGTIPGIRDSQVNALTRMSTDLMPLVRAVNDGRRELTTAALTDPRNAAAIQRRADALKSAELAVANARATAFSKIQASPNRLTREHVNAFLAMGGSFAGVTFTLPEPLNYADHDGYISLFDGVSLKGWDGNPKFWRAENGAIVGESTPQNPSGNSYIVYRNLEAKDFTLKFEIKVEGSGGSGFQYRSKTGLPWLANIPENVTANVGPVNLNWMMTGPQADFWPSSRDWTGQFYSENTPLRVLAWRGQVVEGAGLASKRLMGNIGDRQELRKFTKMDDWNQYTVIARGGTLIHILNGQLMAVMVDDDPASSNNQAGLFGIEIEATTKVSVRNIWVKKLN